MSSQDNSHRDQEKCSEETVYGLFRSAGWVFPKTPSDVDRAERELAQDSSPVPDDIANPYEILNRLEQRDAPTTPSTIPLPENTAIPQDLARAARDGKDLSDELEKRMESDRRKAEQDADGQ